MVTNAPTINEVLPKFVNFVSNMNIVGHNVHFDINFLYDNMDFYLILYNVTFTPKIDKKLEANQWSH